MLVIAKDMGQTGNLTITVTLPAGFCPSTSVAEPSGGRAGRSVRAGTATLRRLLAPAGLAATHGVQWGVRVTASSTAGGSGSLFGGTSGAGGQKRAYKRCRGCVLVDEPPETEASNTNGA